MSYTHTVSLSVLHVSRETIRAFGDNLRAVSPVAQKRFSHVIIVSRETYKHYETARPCDVSRETSNWVMQIARSARLCE